VVSWGAPAMLAGLVVPVVLAVGAVLRHRARVAAQRRLASPGVWRRTMGGAPATGLIRMLLWSAAGAALVLALARPMWGELPRQAEVRTRDVVFAIDVSASMRCPDLRPSRLAVVLGTLRRVLPLLDGNRIGVVVFSGDAYPLVPLTIDLDAVATFLDGVEPGMVALPGSNLQRAVSEALDLLPAEGTGRILVLATDGENLQGDVDAAAKRLSEAGVTVIGLLAGTASGGVIPVEQNGRTVYLKGPDGKPVVTRADPRTLARLAGGKGAVIDLAAGDAVHRLAETIARIQTRSAKEQAPVRRIERFPLFLGVAAALLAAGFLLPPWRRLATLALVAAVGLAAPARAEQGSPSGPVPPAPPAAAAQDRQPGAGASGTAAPASRPPLWQRLLPGGARRLARRGAHRWAAGDPGGAAAAFGQALALDPENPARRYDLGTALAEQGDLERALPLLGAAAKDPELAASAAYNAGTAALRAGRADAAVKLLRQALLGDPSSPDVKRNYEIALRMLQQQKQQQQQEKQQNKDSKQEKQQQQEGRKNQEQQKKKPQAAPTPRPTPDARPIYGALERAEREAKRTMNRPTPAPVRVEKDW